MLSIKACLLFTRSKSGLMSLWDGSLTRNSALSGYAKRVMEVDAELNCLPAHGLPQLTLKSRFSLSIKFHIDYKTPRNSRRFVGKKPSSRSPRDPAAALLAQRMPSAALPEPATLLVSRTPAGPPGRRGDGPPEWSCASHGSSGLSRRSPLYTYIPLARLDAPTLLVRTPPGPAGPHPRGRALCGPAAFIPRLTNVQRPMSQQAASGEGTAPDAQPS